ncbi:MAG: DUF6447 family protein [Novosphingobium sp.]
MASNPSNTIVIDGKEYSLDDLNDETKQLIGSIRGVDTEITRLRRQLAIAQTARNAYARSVAAKLPKDGEAEAVTVVEESTEA